MRKIFELVDALNSLYPGGNWSWEMGHADPYDGLNWMAEDIPKPSAEELNTELARLEAEYDSQYYKIQRAAAYPSLAEQLDMQYWDNINGTNNWQELIQSIKSQYPKP